MLALSPIFVLDFWKWFDSGILFAFHYICHRHTSIMLAFSSYLSDISGSESIVLYLGDLDEGLNDLSFCWANMYCSVPMAPNRISLRGEQKCKTVVSQKFNPTSVRLKFQAYIMCIYKSYNSVSFGINSDRYIEWM